MKKGLKIAKRVCGWIFNILMILLVIFSCFTVYNSRVTGQPASIFGYRPVFILSGSMEPEIKTHSLIISKNLNDEDKENLKVGDVVTYTVLDEWEGKKLTITHRIHDISENEEGTTIYTTKGDNNNTADIYELTADNLQAKVVFTWNGFATLYNQWNSGLLGKFLILAPVAIISLAATAIKYLLKKE